jgi:hypothetical protein
LGSWSPRSRVERTHARRALPLGSGVAITFVIALAYDWTLAYLAPICAAPLLRGPATPTLRAALGIILVTSLIMPAGVVEKSCLAPDLGGRGKRKRALHAAPCGL